MNTASTQPEPAPSESIPDLTDPASIWDTITGSFEGLVDTFLENLPIYILAILVFVLGLLLMKQALRGVDRGLGRAKLDTSIEVLTKQVLRAGMIFALVLLALSIAGVQVGSVLATLGLAGLAVAFALQNILENFIAGILILVRRPFKIGDLIQTGDYEGYVNNINLRVTRLHDIHGEVFLIPNAEVFSNAITNLSELGRRRTTVMIGIDYRDDHTIVEGLLLPILEDCSLVLSDPPPDVLLTELGDSSVNFRLRFWTAPDPLTIARATSEVLTRSKSAVEGAGMTIPWPIRTLAVDDHPAALAAQAERDRSRGGA